VVVVVVVAKLDRLQNMITGRIATVGLRSIRPVRGGDLRPP
jgi:hypothetical protein